MLTILVLAACTGSLDDTGVESIESNQSKAPVMTMPFGAVMPRGGIGANGAKPMLSSSNAEFGFQLPHKIYPFGDWRDGTSGYPYAVAVGDVTRDGRDDVVLVNLRNLAAPPLETDHKVLIYAQRADGELDTPTLHAYSDGLYGVINNFLDVSLSISDLDNDGFKDIIVGYAKGLTFLLSREHGFETRKFLIAPEYGGLAPGSANQSVAHIVVVDVNRDGYKDVIAFNKSSGATIFINDKSGGVSQTTSTLQGVIAPTDVKVADLDSDGLEDIVVLSGGRFMRRFWLIKNRGEGTLSDDVSHYIEADETYGGIAVGDWTGDDRPDIAISISKNIQQYGLPAGLLIFEQSGNGQLSAPYVIPTWHIPNSMFVTDLNGDNVTDLLVDHAGWDIGYLLKESDVLLPERIVNYGGVGGEGSGPQVIAAGDINGDGCKDIVRAEVNISLMVYIGENCLRHTRVTGGPNRARQSN